MFSAASRTSTKTAGQNEVIVNKENLFPIEHLESQSASELAERFHQVVR